MRFYRLMCAMATKLQPLRCGTKVRTCLMFHKRCESTSAFPNCSDTSSSGAKETKSEQDRHNVQEMLHQIDVKTKILLAALDFVPQYGWSLQALAHGAKMAGFSAVAHGIFERGEFDLVDFFYATCNKKLEEHLRSNPLQNNRKRGDVTEYLENALKYRLEMIVPFIDSWDQALSLMARPQHLQVTTKHLYKIVDDIWYFAGDQSVNFSWYTKRIAIAGAYSVSELVLLQDKSEDFSKTWSFLKRQMEVLDKLDVQKKKAEDVIEGLPNVIESSVITLRNVAGLRR